MPSWPDFEGFTRNLVSVLRGNEYIGIKHELKEVLAVTDQNSANKVQI